MAYREVHCVEIREVIRRWQAGLSQLPDRWRHGSVAADGAALHRGGGGGRA